MFVINGLQGNKFVSVPIPASCEIFQRLNGTFAKSVPESAFSGDASTRQLSKMDTIVAAEIDFNAEIQQDNT